MRIASVVSSSTGESCFINFNIHEMLFEFATSSPCHVVILSSHAFVALSLVVFPLAGSAPLRSPWALLLSNTKSRIQVVCEECKARMCVPVCWAAAGGSKSLDKQDATRCHGGKTWEGVALIADSVADPGRSATKLLEEGSALLACCCCQLHFLLPAICEGRPPCYPGH